MTTSRPVAAVVLAAGQGSRLGGRKLERPWGDATILQTVLATLQAAGVRDVVVVLGCEAERLRPLVEAAAGPESSVRAVVNPRWEDGMLTSVQTGLHALGAVSAALIVPGDQPDIAPCTVRAVVAAFEPSTDGLIVPVHGGRRGHPLLIAADLFPLVDELDPAVGLRQLRERVPGRARELAVDDAGVLVDIDTPEDYRRHLPAKPA